MRTLALTTACLLPVLAFAQEGPYTITGSIGKENKFEKAYLYSSNSKGRLIDSVAINNGSFTFTGKTDIPARAFLFTGNTLSSSFTANRLVFYLEQGKIRIESADSIASATVKGGAANTVHQQYKAASRDVNKRSDALSQKYYATPVAEREQEAFKQQYQADNKAIAAAQQKVVTTFIKAHPNTSVSLDALTEWAGYDPDPAVVEPVFKLLSPAIRKSKAGEHFAAQLESQRRTAIGVIAPEFTQNDTLGHPVALKDFRGKYVLVDFWASWCGPCRQENPNVVEAFHKYKDKNFTILGVSLDNENGKSFWMQAIHDDKLQWTQVSDLKGWKNEAAKMYGVQGIPANFLIGPDGKIVGKNLRGEALEKKLASLLQ
ncbi:redoxin domain-containing protein [Chitinophaga sp. 22536]|uniref:redoxin domain-containing protein n=1 Tax=unclassified Chitinophaga TaxID=2619133 RepID=UPI003F856048